jgi:hypothetical protein
MALITSTASGNFDAGATWTGGVVPTVGDEARAATGHTITINVNTTCDEVSNEGTGIFTLNDGITLTANVTNKSSTTNRNCVQFTAASPAVATIVGTLTGSSAGGTHAVANTSSGTLNITGACRAGAGGIGANNASTGTIAITGNCSGNISGSGGGSASHGANNASTGTLTVTGNCTGSTGGSSGAGVNNASTGSATITGNCTGNAAGTGAANASTGTLTITGNCTGGPSTSAGAANTSTGTMIVNGPVYASETANGVSGSNRAQVTRLTGPFYTTDTFGVNPIGCLAWRWDTVLNNTTFIEVPSSVVVNGVFVRRNLVTPDNATNFPSASNVRSGTTYGISSALTGTCAVPSAASVATGVPVDNTTGTASLTPADFWNALTSGMTTSGSIGVRLKNASTLDSTGQQLADALSP